MMDQVPQSSFIPRQSPNMVVEAPRARRGRLNLLSAVSLVCFFGALLLSVGVFLLKQGHVQSLENKKTELSEKRSFFRQEDIDSVRALDERIEAAETLMDGHISPSVLLTLLERTTQEEIQYRGFQFSRRPSGNVSVAMQGIAPRFNTVARQAQRYADEDLFSHVIFSGLDKPSPNFVMFQVDLDISKNAIAYDAVAAAEESKPQAVVENMNATSVTAAETVSSSTIISTDDSM
ncbi:MAG: hypothetical protein RLZZ234_166 [Candidatus Parcubacteria bacterium]|jgi:hypothetical protein